MKSCPFGRSQVRGSSREKRKKVRKVGSGETGSGGLQRLAG